MNNQHSFTDVFIQRPVFATVVSLIILLVGFMAYRELQVRQFPEIQTSVISITVTYPGASAKLMEGFVAVPIESAISNVDGIDYVTSSSTIGTTAINVYLKENYNLDNVLHEVSSKVNSVRDKLPKDIDDPVIAKQDPNSNPILFLSFSSKTLSPAMITDYLTRVIRPQFENVEGVSQAVIFGEKTYAMRIWLNPYLMSAHSITPSDVSTQLQANNVQSVAGKIKTPLLQYGVTAKTDLNTANQFNQLVIKEENKQLIRIQDVGEAELGPKFTNSSLTLDGKPTVVMGIIPKSTANPLNISKAIRALLPQIQEGLPGDLVVQLNWDASRFISESLDHVYQTIFEASLFVLIVIFLFLGSFRAVFIPAVTIPLSILGIASIIYLLHFSVNTITLLGVVLAIGMVVDDAIVVLENIHRHFEAGMPPLQAALIGAREIRFPIISMTLTLAAVYAPITFMQGLTGTLFREFALVLAGSVIVSGFIALTLSPMLCSKLISGHITRKSLEHKIDLRLRYIRMRYFRLLKKSLDNRSRIATLVTFSIALLVVLWNVIPHELVPTEDQGAIMGIVQGPTNANLNYTEKYTKQIEKIYSTIPETDHYVVINGFPNGERSALSFLILKPWSERKRSATQIRNALFPPMWSLPGVFAFPVELPSLPGAVGNTPVDFVLKTTADYPELNRAIQKILAKARQQNPKLLNIDTDLKLNSPEVNLAVDRNKAADLGISMNEIGNTLALLLSEPVISKFVINGRSYDVIPQLYASFRKNPETLKQVYIRTRNGELTQFSNIIDEKAKLSPESLLHFQQLRAAKITASLVPGYTIGQALDYLSQLAKSELPNNIQFDYAGQSRQFIQASGSLVTLFVFAIVFIYLVLSAQFESFRDPIVVMTSVPLCITGGIAAMFLSGSTFNLYTIIGLVTLIGLITKHGILMVEFANQLQLQGKQTSLRGAIMQAAAIRLRPILMTTAAMILGALPLALASGPGSESRSQIGWVIVGGMSFGTMLTLFVVPLVYILISKPKEKQLV